MKANDRRGNNEAVGKNRRCTFPFFPSLVPIIIATEFSSRFSISLPVLYVAKRKTGSSNVARFYPISPDNIRRWPKLAEVARYFPKIARCAISSTDDALVVQYLLHAYAPIYVRHDALPMQTCYAEHGRRETQRLRDVNRTRGAAPLVLRHETCEIRWTQQELCIAFLFFLTDRLCLAQFRNSQYYGELEA